MSNFSLSEILRKTIYKEVIFNQLRSVRKNYPPQNEGFPPFSLFREYVTQLIEYGKKFIIIGHQNSLTTKEIFPLLRDNKLWLGYGFKGGAAHFYSAYEDTATAGDHREGMIRVSGVVWLTNMDITKRHEELDLYKTYSPEAYPSYANYEGINVAATSDIPGDYEGIMGVPITFLDKYNPEQFDIIDCHEPCIDLETFRKMPYFHEYKSRQLVYKGVLCQKTYHRLFIRNKHPQKPII